MKGCTRCCQQPAPADGMPAEDAAAVGFKASKPVAGGPAATQQARLRAPCKRACSELGATGRSAQLAPAAARSRCVRQLQHPEN